MYVSINPDMLVLARESREINQSDLAKRIGISQGKLSKAEKGEQKLHFNTFNTICKIVDYPEDFFYQTPPYSLISHYYYRNRLSVPQGILIKLEALINIYKKNLDELTEAIDLPEYQLEAENFDDLLPAEIANQIRFILRIPRGPIENLINTLERCGIVIIKTDILHEKIDAISTVTDKGLRVIFLYDKIPCYRQRFLLAREFGHMLMHFNKIPAPEKDIENEADGFASELLMPESDIIDSLSKLSFPKLGNLKRYWKVSIKAIIYRARALGVISENVFRDMMIEYSHRGMNKREPVLIPGEEPYILKEIINLHKNELGYSNEELARVLKISIRDYEERFGFYDKPKLKIMKHAR